MISIRFVFCFFISIFTACIIICKDIDLDIKKGETIYEKYLSKQKVLEIIKICEENSISYNVYTDDAILATSLKYNVLYYYIL